jgi:DnaJ homolog subfamily C member 19
MLRIAILLVIACVVFRWAFGQWPWQSMGTGSVRKTALAKARGLLGVEKGATREDIIAAHRRLAALVHPDRGGTHDAMHEATAARDLLLAQLPPAPPAIQDRDDKP